MSSVSALDRLRALRSSVGGGPDSPTSSAPNGGGGPTPAGADASGAGLESSHSTQGQAQGTGAADPAARWNPLLGLAGLGEQVRRALTVEDERTMSRQQRARARLDYDLRRARIWQRVLWGLMIAAGLLALVDASKALFHRQSPQGQLENAIAALSEHQAVDARPFTGLTSRDRMAAVVYSWAGKNTLDEVLRAEYTDAQGHVLMTRVYPRTWLDGQDAFQVSDALRADQSMPFDKCTSTPGCTPGPHYPVAADPSNVNVLPQEALWAALATVVALVLTNAVRGRTRATLGAQPPQEFGTNGWGLLGVSVVGAVVAVLALAQVALGSAFT